MVQVDGAGSDSLVDPGVACWVGISGAPEAREERGLSAWQFAVLARSLAELQPCLDLLFSPCPLGRDFGYPATHNQYHAVKKRHRLTEHTRSRRNRDGKTLKSERTFRLDHELTICR